MLVECLGMLGLLAGIQQGVCKSDEAATAAYRRQCQPE
jgi:hypothetical protein